MTISKYASKAYDWLRSDYKSDYQDKPLDGTTPLEERTKIISYLEGAKEGVYVSLGTLASNDPIMGLIATAMTMAGVVTEMTDNDFAQDKDFGGRMIDLIVKRGTQFVGGVAGGYYKIAAPLLSSVVSRIVYLLPEKLFYPSSGPQATQCEDTGFIGRIALTATSAVIGGALVGPWGAITGAAAAGAFLGKIDAKSDTKKD